MSTFDINTVKLEAEYNGLRKDEPHAKGEKPWEYNAWTVTLSRPEGRPITTTYKMGTGLKTKPFTRGGLTKPLAPTVRDVLQSLQSDASDIHAGCTFEEWADSLGYDSDSRRALAVYLACQEIHGQLRKLFGREVFDAFMDFDFDEMRPRSEAFEPAEVSK